MQDVLDGIRFQLDRGIKSMDVRDLAISITYDKQDKIFAIYHWVKQNVQYVSDPIRPDGHIELFISPVRLVKDHKLGKIVGEDCDGHAILITSLYRSIGINSRVVLIDSRGDGLDHAYSEVWSDKLGEWLSADTTAEYPLGWIVQGHGKVIV